MPHEIIQTTEHDPSTTAAVRWIVGISLSGVLAAVQNWFRRREQEKRLKQQSEEFRQELAATVAAASQLPRPEETEDIHLMIAQMQQSLAAQGELQDERHTANLTRFQSIETQHRTAMEQWREDTQGIRADLRQSRSEMEGLRTDTRKQTELMKTILATVTDLKEDRAA